MKTIFAIGLTALAMGAFAAADDVLISFSTPGPDTYADGTTVLNGERYALVWQKKGTVEAFAINGDGTTANGEIVLVAPLAKDGKCPPVVFEVDKAVYDAKGYAGGTFAVYMLDTRIQANELYASGKVGMTDFVNGYAAATASQAASGQGNTLAANAVNGAAVGVALEVAAPTITSMKVADGKVTITVSGMSPAATYSIMTGTDVKDLVRPVPAKADGDTFQFDAAEGGRFFKVRGSKNF